MENLCTSRFRKNISLLLSLFIMGSIFVSCSVNGPNYPMVRASKQDQQSKQKIAEQHTQKKSEHISASMKSTPADNQKPNTSTSEAINTTTSNEQNATVIQRVANNKKVQKLESKINKVSRKKNEFNKEYKAGALSNEQLLIVLLAVVLVFLLFGGPGWGWWAFYNIASVLLLILLVVLVLYLAGII